MMRGGLRVEPYDRSKYWVMGIDFPNFSLLLSGLYSASPPFLGWITFKHESPVLALLGAAIAGGRRSVARRTTA
jgi:hypothetical protein